MILDLLLCSLAKRLESANTMFSFVWWIVGFYWITAGGQALSADAPHLYWYEFVHNFLAPAIEMIRVVPTEVITVQVVGRLVYCSCKVCVLELSAAPVLMLLFCWVENMCRLCVVFLAFDVFFVVFCVALACVIGIAVCCCLPCIIAILYAVADQVRYVGPLPPFSLHCWQEISRSLMPYVMIASAAQAI